MSSNENSNQDTGYKIDVSAEVAFAITYDDSQGRLLFAIEIGANPKIIFLNPRPSKGGRIVEKGDEATKVRVDLAVERVTAYFRSKGLAVELD